MNENNKDYIKGYNDALGDIRFLYYAWHTHKLREKGDPVVLKREVELMGFACGKLRKVDE